MSTPRRQGPVVFDFDGTLADTANAWFAAEAAVAATYGYSWSELEHQSLRGLGLNDAACRLATHVRAPTEDVLGDLLDSYSEQVDQVQRMPGAPHILEALHNDRTLAVATNSPTHLVEHQLAHLGLAHHFDVVVGAGIGIRSKPHPDTYQHVARRLDHQAAQLVALEDTQTGITAARHAGCTTIGVSRTTTLDDCWQADTLYEALEVLHWIDRHAP